LTAPRNTAAKRWFNKPTGKKKNKEEPTTEKNVKNGAARKTFGWAQNEWDCIQKDEKYSALIGRMERMKKNLESSSPWGVCES